MDNNQLNQDMKRLFNHYQPELDTDEIWENIEPFLDEKKKKRRFFFIWWGLAGLAIILAWTLFPVNQNTINSQEEVSQILHPKLTESGQAKDQDYDLLTSTSDQENDLQNNTALNPTNESSDDAPSTIMKTAATSPVQLIEKTAENNSKRSSIIPIDQEAEDTFDYLQPDLEENKNTTIRTATWETESLPTLQFSLLASNEEKIDIGKMPKRKNKPVKQTKKVKPKQKKKWRHNMQFYFAPELALQQLSAVNSAERDLVSQRKDSEDPGLSYRLGLNYQLIQTNGLILSTGLNYEQINDLFNWTNSSSSIDLNYTGIVSITVNAVGDTIRRRTGQKEREVITTSTRQFTNHYRFINIPVGIGLERRFRNSHMKFTGGVNFNLAFFMKGYILNRQREPINLDRSIQNGAYNSIFEKRTQMGLWASYEYSRAINPRISWLIAPEIHFPLGSLTKDEYQIKHRYYSLQLRLGVNCLLATNRD